VLWLLQKLHSFLSFSFFVLCVVFENVFSPKGWQNNSPNCKILKCSDLIHFPMVLRISICKLDAKNIPDAFKHVPDLFRRLQDRKTRTKPNILKTLKTCPEKIRAECAVTSPRSQNILRTQKPSKKHRWTQAVSANYQPVHLSSCKVGAKPPRPHRISTEFGPPSPTNFTKLHRP